MGQAELCSETLTSRAQPHWSKTETALGAKLESGTLWWLPGSNTPTKPGHYLIINIMWLDVENYQMTLDLEHSVHVTSVSSYFQNESFYINIEQIVCSATYSSSCRVFFGLCMPYVQPSLVCLPALNQVIISLCQFATLRTKVQSCPFSCLLDGTIKDKSFVP